MNLLEIGCSCLTLPHLKAFMELVRCPGYSGDVPNRIWPVENIPFNWVEGLRASISLTLGEWRDARMIVRVQPYRAQGFL
jgi:hypothetical protein